jgi:hypothetical protein
MTADPLAFVSHRNAHLPIKRQVLFAKLDRHGVLVRVFLQSGTECAMHFNRTADDAFGQVVNWFVHDMDDEQERIRAGRTQRVCEILAICVITKTDLCVLCASVASFALWPPWLCGKIYNTCDSVQ